MKRIAAVLILAAVLGGCTTVRYNVDTHEVRYFSVMQRKTLVVTEDVNPATGLRSLRLDFSTDSDPAVQMMREAASLAAKGAATAAK